MRLIDADKLLKEIDEAGKEVSKHIGENGNASFDRGFMYGLATIFVNIKRQPTAFDVEKVVSELGKEIKENPYQSEYLAGLYKAIEIVKAGEV